MEKYFVIIGRESKLALRELRSFVDATEFSQHVYLTTKEFDFSRLGGAVKRGRLINKDQLGEELADVSLVGSSDDQLAKLAKKDFGVRRYKTFDLLHTDKEVVEKGLEIVDCGEYVGIVTGRQDIQRYELLDMHKPVRGMEIGMMPAKLAQMLVNIGVGGLDTGHSEFASAPQNDEAASRELTIYDPFCGFGTTLFVANSLGYNAIGSDTNPALAQQNIKRWQTTDYATDSKITHFKHDATTEFTKPFLKHVDLIVSEGRLGPVVYENTHPEALVEHIDEIMKLYTGFLQMVRQRISVPIVIAFPSYTYLPLADVQKNIENLATISNVEINHIGRYGRKGQLVHREILVIQ